MFGSLLDKSTGWLGQRLVGTLLLPSLAFWAGIGALVVTHVGWSRAADRWNALGGARQLLICAGAVAGLLVFVLLAMAVLPALVRAYEGYWLLRHPFGRLGRLGVSLQRRRWQRLRLTDPRDYGRRYRCFPPEPRDLMPTRLGNALRAAESYASDERRYGMDAVFFWPRLYPLLPDSLRSALGAARASLEQFLVLAALSAAFVPVTAVLAMTPGLPLPIWLPTLVVGPLLSILAYRAAVSAALGYGELVRSAFDTHRRALLTALGLALPATLEAERALWQALAQQLYRRDTDHPELLRFTTDPPVG
ncbi:hypothetical protein ABZ471_30265 [Streptomyces sp. NPDC005728]|uniref:hypothetical protein n=1 Tax=Streptomyces sp. NPDC005728 TaxID=3157054 RepID=UPI0033E94B2A